MEMEGESNQSGDFKCRKLQTQRGVMETSRVSNLRSSASMRQMTPEEAIDIVRDRYPFEGYMDTPRGAYLNISMTVLRNMEPGGQILDFGSGPCDKTSVLQTLGFECSAYDDLQDHWHKINGNRQKIIAFTKECGIDFKLADGSALPFQKNHFDMLMMHDVLEHLHDSPRDLLNDLLELVKPEGLFFATVPNAANIRKRISVLVGKTNMPDFSYYYWHPDPWRGHVREYVREDLVMLCGHLDLEVIELRGCHHMLQRLHPVAQPPYLAMTRIFPSLRDTWSLVARKRKGWAKKGTLNPEELIRILGSHTPYVY